MAEGTTFRLDTADLALEAGWQAESTSRSDEFSKDGVTVTVLYTPDDEITSIVQSGKRTEDEVYGADSAGKQERLRIWLTGRATATVRPSAVATSGGVPRPRTAAEAPPSAKIDYHLRPKPVNWTFDEFVDAVSDPVSRAFLVRLLELVYENDQLPSERYPFRLWLGKRPKGAMYVYPFGRRYSPFMLTVGSGQLKISGCWHEYKEVTGKREHPGYAAIADLLGQSERGTQSAVPVAGFDADEVWKVGEAVSRSVNG